MGALPFTLKHHKNADNVNHHRYEVWQRIFWVDGFMKKTITRIVAAGLGTGLLVVGGAWFVMSGNTISHTETLIAKLNAKALPQNGTLKLTYDSLARSTFPTVGVRVVNPVLTVNIPADDKGHPAIDGVWKRTGSITIITDYLNHSYRVVNDGAGTMQVKSGAENVTLSSQPSHIELLMTAKNREAFTKWNTLNLDDNFAVQNALRDIGVLTLSISPLAIKDADSNATIYSQNESHFALTNRSTPALLDFELNLAFNGTEVTSEYGPVMRRMVRAMQLPEITWDEQLPFSASRAGKQDLALEMKVNIPQTTGPMSNAFIHVPTFSLKNNFFHLQLPLSVVLKEVNNLNTANVKLDAKLDVAPAAAQEMQTAIDALTPDSDLGAALLQLADIPKTGINHDALKQKLMAALPTLSTLGPVTLTIDIDGSIPANTDAANIAASWAATNIEPPAETDEQAETNPNLLPKPNEHLTINALNFNHARWGIEVKGMVAHLRGYEPSLDINLLCKRCDNLTADLFETAKAVEEMSYIIDPKQPQRPVSEHLLPSINEAIAEIGAKNPATGDVVFGLAAKGDGEYSINNMSLEQIMPKLMTTLEKISKAESRATGTAAPLPTNPKH